MMVRYVLDNVDLLLRRLCNRNTISMRHKLSKMGGKKFKISFGNSAKAKSFKLLKLEILPM